MATRFFGPFEWREEKAETNLRDHGVDFEEATTVFEDPYAIELVDLTHPERFVTIGYSFKFRALFVVFCESTDHQRMRIISARLASPVQRKHYESARKR